MNRAKVFAEAMNRVACGDCAYLYDDGFVIVLAASGERRKLVSSVLSKFFDVVEQATSDDGFLTAFVVPTEMSYWPALPESEGFGVVTTLTESYTDHRPDDAHTLDLAARQLSVAVGG